MIPATFKSCEIFVSDDKRVIIHGESLGIGVVYLGRAKGAYSWVPFANTYLSKTIVSGGWTDWSYAGGTENLFHAEYKCLVPGSESNGRASWSKQLKDKEAASILSINYIHGTKWLPVWL
ncbi:hypothetical protein L6164_013672 [Bauhinia variegata]|uniref:Uncharacterized protein n=1 Tax=Bauhinia variegata TaxID=167791 RepID=A0ACB9NII2_BAUVA|nr:hypothetical protein L6164_013672 [Bauhinia variegata]